MDKMDTIFLGKSRVTGEGLKQLSPMRQLKTLYLEDTNVRRLQYFAQFPRLEKVSLAGTLVKDQELRHLNGLANLEWLQLGNTDITDEGLVYLARCKKLTQLDLRKTWVSDEGAAAIRKALPGCKVYHVRPRTR